MAARGPWSVKGIDAKAREAALEAARSEGVTLGDYLNRLLLEADRGETYMARPSTQDAEKFAANDGESQAVTTSPANDAIEALTRRIEATEARSTLSVTGIDQSVVGLLARINNAEQSQQAMEGRIEFASEELRQAQDILKRRIERVESDDTSEQNLRALKSLEHTLERLSNRVEETRHANEVKTSDVAGRLDDIDTRLGSVKKAMDDTLSDVAARVAKAVEDAELRSEGASRHLADRVSRVEERVGSTLTKVSDSVERLTGTVSETEDRSMRAMDIVTRLDEEARSKLSDVDASLTDISDRLSRAETSTDSALLGLESSFSRLDKRLDLFEEDMDGGSLSEFRDQVESRIQKVQEDLIRVVTQTRQDLAEQIEQVATVPTEAFSEMNTAVSEMHKRLRRAEQRQTQSVEAIGEEVARLTETLDKRVQVVEQRNHSELSGSIREQIEELANTFHARLADLEAREDTTGLATMSNKVSELATALTARVEASEEHSASAIREFTEHVTTLTKSLQARQEEGLNRVTSEIKASEERQNKSMSGAIASVTDRIERVEAATSASISPIQKAMSSLADRLQAVEDFSSPVGGLASTSSAMSFGNFDEKLNKAEPKPSSVPSKTSSEFGGFKAASIPDEDELTQNDPWALEEDSFAAPRTAGAPMDELPAEFSADLSDTEYDLDDAETDDFSASGFTNDIPDDAYGAKAGPDDYLARARAAALAGQDTSRSRKPSVKKQAKGGSSKFPLVAAASVLALTAVGTAGYMMMRGKQDASMDYLDVRAGAANVGESSLLSFETASDFVIEDDADLTEGAPVEAGEGEEWALEEGIGDALANETEVEAVETPAKKPVTAEVTPPVKKSEAPAAKPAARVDAPAPIQAQVERSQPTPTPTSSPLYATGASTQSPAITPPQIPAPSTQPALPAGVADYQSGVTMIDAGQITEGVERVRRAAENGLPIAQYRMSKLYERGQGVPRDLEQSRSWTEKAAEGGNVKAMHDLAVFYAEGEGGAQSYAGAVKWFRQAADYGLVDSQYNLGVLYEQGLGVSANPSEALYWFRVAERLGDGAATSKVAALSAQVEPEMAQQTEKLAAAYQPQVSNALANGRFPEQQAAAAQSASTPVAAEPVSVDGQTRLVREAQVLLGQMGYNAGVPDGDFGSQTRAAILTFQAANGLPQSGQVTPTLIRQMRFALNGE